MFEYNRWANRAILDSCEQLPRETLDVGVAGTFGSIREILVHIVSGQVMYTGHLAQDPDRYAVARALRGEWPGFAALRQAAERSDADLVSAALTLADDAHLPVPPWDGTAYTFPESFILLEALYHGVEHRGQICTTLTQAGVTPPELDGWGYALKTGLGRPISSG